MKTQRAFMVSWAARSATLATEEDAMPDAHAIRPTLLAVALLVALGAGPGCKKRQFEPGVYHLTGVFQIVKDAEGEESNRTEMRVVGMVSFTFDFDGEFLVEYSNFGVGFERACSGNYRGRYIATEQEVVLDAKKMRLPSYCRPDTRRTYRWDSGWGGTMTLERPWEDNQFILYRLEPAK